MIKIKIYLTICLVIFFVLSTFFLLKLDTEQKTLIKKYIFPYKIIKYQEKKIFSLNQNMSKNIKDFNTIKRSQNNCNYNEGESI